MKRNFVLILLALVFASACNLVQQSPIGAAAILQAATESIFSETPTSSTTSTPTYTTTFTPTFTFTYTPTLSPTLPDQHHTSATFTDQPDCSQPSGGKLYTVEKHGYTSPADIPWPAYK